MGTNRLAIVTSLLLVCSVSYAHKPINSRVTTVPLVDCLGKDAAWMAKKFGAPLVEPNWQVSKSRPQLGSKMYRTGTAVYSVNRPDPQQLDALFAGPVGTSPKVTQVSWLGKTNNGWSVDRAAKDVGLNLREFREVARDPGYEPTTRFFVNRKNPRIRAILFEANGSRVFHIEWVL